MTLGDLAQRLYTTFAEAEELSVPKSLRFTPSRWEELPKWRQEVWVIVASEAVKVGMEIQQAAVRTAYAINDEQLKNDPDLQESLRQMQCGEGRVLVDVDEDLFVDIPTADEDEAPKLKEIVDRPRRFVRVRRDCE